MLGLTPPIAFFDNLFAEVLCHQESHFPRVRSVFTFPEEGLREPESHMQQCIAPFTGRCSPRVQSSFLHKTFKSRFQFLPGDRDPVQYFVNTDRQQRYDTCRKRQCDLCFGWTEMLSQDVQQRVSGRITHAALAQVFSQSFVNIVLCHSDPLKRCRIGGESLPVAGPGVVQDLLHLLSIMPVFFSHLPRAWFSRCVSLQFITRIHRMRKLVSRQASTTISNSIRLCQAGLRRLTPIGANIRLIDWGLRFVIQAYAGIQFLRQESGPRLSPG